MSRWLDPNVREERVRARVLRSDGRWTVLRKVELFIALDAGQVTVHEILTRCKISPEEFRQWFEAHERGGAEALRITPRGLNRSRARK